LSVSDFFHGVEILRMVRQQEALVRNKNLCTIRFVSGVTKCQSRTLQRNRIDFEKPGESCDYALGSSKGKRISARALVSVGLALYCIGQTSRQRAEIT
jgi:hypothetical protein